LTWLAEQDRKTWFLVGSDYVYPRTANRVVRMKAKQLGASIVGETYLPLGSRDVGPLIGELQRVMPEGGVIINTLNGDSNVAFFHGLAEAGLDLIDTFKVMSFSIAEEEVRAIGPSVIAGSYAVWNFYHGTDTPDARRFESAFAESYGMRRLTSAPAASAYSMVHLWARAAERAGSTEVDAVRSALPGTTFASPAGMVEVSETHHLMQPALIGRVEPTGRFEIVADRGTIDPVPFNPLLSRDGQRPCNWKTGEGS
jgi:urea transport system substrate-binding protein